jgi:hypothetical protein
MCQYIKKNKISFGENYLGTDRLALMAMESPELYT